MRVLLALVVLVVAAGGFGYWSMVKQRRGPPPPVCSAAPLARKTFGKPIQVTSKASPGRYNIEPHGTLLPSGNVAFVYTALAGMFTDNVLGVGTIGPDGKVAERPLASAKKRHFDPWMATDPKGLVHLVWLGHDGGRPDQHMQVGYATSTDGLAYSAPAATNDFATDCPNDAAGCMDKPMIVSFADANVVFYYSDPGGGFKAVRVEDGGRRVAGTTKVGGGAYGSVALAPSGRIHVAWVDSDDEEGIDRWGDVHLHVDYSMSDDRGRSFAKPLRVSSPSEPIPFFFSNPQIAADEPRGLLYAVYPTGRRDGRWDITLATSRNGGHDWKRIRVNDDAPCANHMTPLAALDPKTGTLHVVWLENRTGKGAVAYAACDSGGERCSPNEAVSDAPFASYSFARHQSDWLGEYGALLVDAERRHLHLLWTQPVDEDGDAVSRIFYARADL